MDVMNSIARGLELIGKGSMSADMVPGMEPPKTQTTEPPKTEDTTQTTEPPKTEDTTQTTEPTKPPEFTPYELKPKDKGLLGGDELKPLAELFNGAKVPKEVAEKVHDYVESVTSGTIESVNQALKQRVDAWEAETRKDPEIMNEYGKNTELVRRYLGQQSPGFVDALKETGLLSHPAVVKYLIKQGASASDDRSTGTGTGFSTQQSMEQTVSNIYKGLM